MRGRDHDGMGRRRRAAAAHFVAALVCFIAAAGLAPAVSAAKKGKKPKPPATTQTASAPLSSGGTQTASATCPGGKHVSGGGFAVSPNFNYTGGLFSQNVISHPTGLQTWTVGGSAFTNSVAAGNLTAYARCERNALGRITSIPNISGTVAPASTTTALIDCPIGTHVVGGGYAGTGPGNLTNLTTGTRTIILQSQRTTARQWSVLAYTSSGSPVAAGFTAYAICELNGKGKSVSEASTTTAIGSNVRTAGDPSCTGKTHVVSGGFSITDSDPGNVVAAGVDENHPTGNKGWHLGMYEFGTTVPAGSTLQTFAYCKANATKKRKKN